MMSPMAFSAKSSRSEAGNVPVEGGQVRVTQDVRVVFRIKGH